MNDPDGGQRTSALLFDGSGGLVDRYDKVKLVPFGEYVPFRRWLGWIDAIDQIPVDRVPGDGPHTVQVDGLPPFATPICYENSFPSIERAMVGAGAAFFVLTTNDASYETTAASRQHVVMSRLRAVETGRRRELPLPALEGSVQLGNAATALAVLEAAEPDVLVPDEAVRAGLQAMRLPGRFQVVAGDPEWILDVAHNPDATRALATALAARPCQGRTIAVCGILGDKDIEAIVRALAGQVGQWIAAGLGGPRALPAAGLARRIADAGGTRVTATDSVVAALSAARASAARGDRVLVFGSFLTVGPALGFLGATA